MAALSRAPSMMVKSKSSPAAGNRNASYASWISVKPLSELSGGFRDAGHVLYYQTTATRMRREETMMMMGSCGDVVSETKMKKNDKKKMKKLKLLKGLTKDLSMLPQAGLLGEDDADGISVAAETLLKHLQEMKCKEKELKKKRKEMMKAAKSDSSSSSESSDSECGQVLDLASLRLRSPINSEAPKLDSQVVVDSNLGISSISCDPIQADEEMPLTVEESQTKKIEVCVGGKCKRSGAAQLVEEFEKAVGVGAVVGCKCMGKCRDGPNVRVLSSVEASLSPPPLCIGVGLEDVGVIVANFLGAGTTCNGLASLAVASA